MIKYVKEGSRCPRFYGHAWWDLQQHRTVCFPVPLNWVAGYGYKFWMSLVHGPSWCQIECLRYEIQHIHSKAVARIDGRLSEVERRMEANERWFYENIGILNKQGRPITAPIHSNFYENVIKPITENHDAAVKETGKS